MVKIETSLTYRIIGNFPDFMKHTGILQWECESWRSSPKNGLSRKVSIYTVSSFFQFYSFIYLFSVQYCIGFTTHWHESAMGVHVFSILNPPPSPSHPSGSSQCTSPKHPVSCIEPGLAIHFTYDNIHVSMLFFQIIPPSPLPQSPKDFYTRVIVTVSKFCIYALVYCIGVYLSGLRHSA